MNLSLHSIRSSWREDAACQGADPELFHTNAESSRAMRQMQEVALTHCLGCPVIRECAVWADAMQESGLWGGSYRTWRQPYTRRPLFPGAPLFKMPPRAVESTTAAWVA